MTKTKKSNRKNTIKKQGGARDFYTKFILVINSMQQISLHKLDEAIDFVKIYNHFFSQVKELNNIKLQKKLQFYSNISKFFNETDRFLFNLQYVNNYFLQNSLIENDEDNKTILIKFYDRLNETINNLNNLINKYTQEKNTILKKNYNQRIIQNINNLNNLKNQFIMIIFNLAPKIFLDLTQNILNNKKIIKDNLCSFCSIDKKIIKKKNEYQVEILKLFPSFEEEINPCNVKKFIQNYYKQINNKINNIIKSEEFIIFKENSGKINKRGGGLLKKENKIQKFNNLLKDITELSEDNKISKDVLRNNIQELITKNECQEWIIIKDEVSINELYKNINDNLAEIKNSQLNIANIMSQQNENISNNQLAAEFNLLNSNFTNSNLPDSNNLNSNDIEDNYSLGWNLVLSHSLNKSKSNSQLIIILSNINNILNEYNNQINSKKIITNENLLKEFS
jgi:hypothetical protein